MAAENTGSVVRGILGIQEPLEVNAFKYTPAGIVICDEDGTIYRTNYAAQEMLDSPYPLDGESVHQFIENPEHPKMLRDFVRHPNRAKEKLADGRAVVGKTLNGDPLTVRIYLGHTMWEQTRLAIAVLCPCCECEDET